MAATDGWAFAIWQASTDTYADAVLLDGRFAGRPSQDLNTACIFNLSDIRDHAKTPPDPLVRQPRAPTIRRRAISDSGLRLLAFMEYDVEYVVRDIGSLVFWLNALDSLHADLAGRAALASVVGLNQILAGSVDERGFVTNEHRYLVIAQSARRA